MTVKLKLFKTLSWAEVVKLGKTLKDAGFSRQEIAWAVEKNLELDNPLVIRAINQRKEDIPWWMKTFNFTRGRAIIALSKQNRLKAKYADAEKGEYYNVFRVLSP